MRWSWLTLFLAGCPFLWGPPELTDTAGLAETDGPATDTVDDPGAGTAPTGTAPTGTAPTGTAPTDPVTTPGTDTAAPTDPGTAPGTSTGTDPGTGPAGPSAPEVTALSAEVRYGEVALTFTLADPDGDLDGGAVTLDVDGVATAYAIPGGLDSWAGNTGTIVLAEPVDCAGFAHVYTLAPEDAAGHPGAGEAIDVDVDGYTVAEVAAGAAPLGAVALPVIVCGALKNNTDVDLTSLIPSVGGTWTVTLAYSAGAADFDVEVQDALFSPLAAASAATNPDSTTATFTSGLLHHLEVAVNTGGGSGGDWTVMVHE